MAMELNKLQLGSIDAKNELLTGSDSEIEYFTNSFCLPPNIILDNFITGKKYFVTGLKGIGKTALLRFLSIDAERKLNAVTKFVLFKSHIKEQDRKDICHASRAELIEKNTDEITDNEYETVWKWFLHNQIVDLINTRHSDVFLNDDNLKKYISCVMAPSLGEEEKGIKRLIPKLNKGVIEISKTPKISLDFDWEDKNKTRVKFHNITKQADELFQKLIPSTGHLCLFIDELEVNLGSKKQYTRDVSLIRDLIIAVEQLNYFAKLINANIKIYAAIRTEVLSAIESVGKEINKIIGDFSSQIVWHQSGADNEKHPLLNIITQKIIASETINNFQPDDKNKTVWNRYFPQTIQGINSQKYILHNSWYRPRDIIRTLNLAKDQYPASIGFSQKVFDGTRKNYSQESWVELAEELSVKYSPTEIDGIKQIFNGYKRTFNITGLASHISKREELYPDIELLLKKHKIGTILNDLYNIGFIGNVLSGSGTGINNTKMRFSFRGDPNIILEETMTIHKGLYSFLTL
ncbi:MAG: P-loop ATPase, Sll1717 family [Desulfobulbia bacterium]